MMSLTEERQRKLQIEQAVYDVVKLLPPRRVELAVSNAALGNFSGCGKKATTDIATNWILGGSDEAEIASRLRRLRHACRTQLQWERGQLTRKVAIIDEAVKTIDFIINNYSGSVGKEF